MKGMFKRALAGIAAAALAATGLAMGAATANAAGTPVPDEVSFAFTADTAEQLTNRDLDAYKIGDFVQYGTDPNLVYAVETTEGVDRAALRTALTAAGFANVPGESDTTTDLLAWALSQEATTFDQSEEHPWGVGDNSASRKFADSLAGSLSNTAATKEDILADAALTGAEGVGYSVSVNLPAGLYLFIDRSDGTTSVTKAVPMLASTGVAVAGKLTTVTNPVSINFKNEINADWKKTASAINVTVGQRLTYTLEGKVPVTGAEGFAFYDIPGTGLSIDPTSIKVYKMSIADANLMPGTDYKVTWGTDEVLWTAVDGLYVGNGSNRFAVSINQPVAGTTYLVTYEAVVNSAAANQDKVVNRLVDKNGTDIVPPVETKLFKFDFTKQDAQGNNLAGMKFTITDENGNALQGYTGGNNGDSTSTSKEDGKVEFKGLAAGTYTVTENDDSNDVYMDLGLKFKVSIDNNGNVKFVENSESSTQNVSYDLVDETNRTVTNVKNITELPLTGAAGTALFTVVGLLIAGAGALVYAKSRGVKRALRG